MWHSVVDRILHCKWKHAYRRIHTGDQELTTFCVGCCRDVWSWSWPEVHSIWRDQSYLNQKVRSKFKSFGASHKNCILDHERQSCPWHLIPAPKQVQILSGLFEIHLFHGLNSYRRFSGDLTADASIKPECRRDHWSIFRFDNHYSTSSSPCSHDSRSGIRHSKTEEKTHFLHITTACQCQRPSQPDGFW